MTVRTAQMSPPTIMRGQHADQLPDLAPPRYEAGRTCAVDGCDTRLSTYNASGSCWVHERRRPFIARAERASVNEGPALVGWRELRSIVSRAS